MNKVEGGCILKPIYKWIIKRILTYFLTLYIAVTLTFFLFRLVPGNPVEAFIGQIMATRYAEAEQAKRVVEEYKKMFGLDKPLHIQYICFLRELLRGNLGPSLLNFPGTAQEIILQRLPWTIGLLGISTVISWTIGIILGALLAWKREKNYSKVLTVLAFAFSQVPYYLVAIVLVLVFAYILGVLPARGAYSPFVKPGLSLQFIISVIRHGILPALSIVLTSVFGWALSSRYLVISILAEDYLRYAEAKGLKPSRIFKRYILRNALLPQVTGLGLSLGFMIGGQIVLETIFTYPGIGDLFAAAAANLDYNVLCGIMILIIFVTLTANLILDLIYPFIDPRVRYHG